MAKRSDTPASIALERAGEGYAEIPGEWDGQDVLVEPDNSAAITKEDIRFGLSRIARTLDTFEFAYSKLECRDKNIGYLDALETYVHLRIIDLGQNKLKSCLALQHIQNLLLLNLEDNLIESLTEIPDFPFLQALNLRRNRIKSSEGLLPNCMAYLHLADNKIEDVYGFTETTCPWLTVLELKGNNVKTLVGLDLPQLQRLYLAGNQLTDLNGLIGCPNLTHLHARENKISHIGEIPYMGFLEYVNLRSNNIKRYTQVIELGNKANIKTLILLGNPISTLENYKVEVLAANPNLKRLDKSPVLETELVEARQLRNGREEGTLPGVKDDSRLTAGSISVLDLDEAQNEE